MKKNLKKESHKRWLWILPALCALILFTPSAAMADSSKAPLPAIQQQGNVVKGTVRDANGEPIMGAAVKIEGQTGGTITDLDGNSSLSAPSGSKLQISYIGFTTQTVTANGGHIDVALQEDNSLLDEVVVLGYGAATRKQDLSASVGVIADPHSLAVRPVTNVEGMLQGQLPGVTIQNNGGDPTSAPSLVIRGQGSRNGDNVLWVVDGIPGAPVPSVYDIESIVVLKDAASAAIYGAQSGAGGVILVTTKQAQKGNAQITYEGLVGVRTAVNTITPLNAEQEILMRTTSEKNAGLTPEPGWDVNKNPWIGVTRTNWMDEIFRSPIYQKHSVAFSGGNDVAQSRISFAYNDDEGTLVNTYNKNMTLRFNGNYKINKWVTLSENFTWGNTRLQGGETASAYTGDVLSAIYMPASALPYNPLDGTFGGVTTEDPAYIAQYGSNFAELHGDVVNPLRTLLSHTLFNRVSSIWTTTTLQVHDIIPGLKFTSRFSYNLEQNFIKDFNPITDEPGKPYLKNSLTESTYRYNKWQTENTLTYDNTFGKHTIGALLSTTADHMSERGFEVKGSTFENESAYLQYLAYAKTLEGTDYLVGPDANVSIVARASYSYDDRYFLTASWRRDYASRLPKDNNYGDFPAVTAAWKLSNEPFWHKNDVVNLLKIRASWGRVGNLGSIGYNYKSALLDLDKWEEQALYGAQTNRLFGTLIYNGTALNQNLTWETSEQFDLGVDLSMFSKRLDVSLDYFNKRTFNLIQEQTNNWPNTIGIDPMLVNQGEIKNTGFELQASWSDKLNANNSYWIKGNLAYLKNEVTSTGTLNDDGTPGVWLAGDEWRFLPYVYQTCVGGPLNQFYLIKTDGIFQSDQEAAAYVDKDGNRIQPAAQAGDLKFVDFNQDGTINDADRQYCGSAMPEWTYALSLGYVYKDLSISAMFQGVGGAQAFYAGKSMILSDVEGNFNRSAEILNAWSPENTGSNIPRLSKTDPNSNFSTPSDWYLEDASYLRLKNVTIAYDCTKLIRKWAHLKDRGSMLSVYLSGDNLFTLTKYSGMDPEVGGYDTVTYPVSRVISFGVKLTY